MFPRRPDYLLKVRGMSMRDAGIMDGDLLAVQKAKEAKNGQIVVARLGDDVTVKRLRRTKARHRADPREPRLRDHRACRPTTTDFELEGMAVGPDPQHHADVRPCAAPAHDLKSPKAGARRAGRVRDARAAAQHRPVAGRRPAAARHRAPARAARRATPSSCTRRCAPATGKRQDPCVLDTFMAATDFMRGAEPAPWWPTRPRKRSTAGLTAAAWTAPAAAPARAAGAGASWRPLAAALCSRPLHGRSTPNDRAQVSAIVSDITAMMSLQPAPPPQLPRHPGAREQPAHRGLPAVAAPGARRRLAAR